MRQISSDAGGVKLPQFVRDLLASAPHRGGGLNKWFFRVARYLHALRSRDEIVELLRAATHGEPLQHNEIERAVDRSKEKAWRPGEPSVQAQAAPRWPEVNHKKRAEIIKSVGIELVDLWELSPRRFDDNESHSDEIIDALFPGNPLLCCGLNERKFNTRPREAWRGKLSDLQFIVPSPMNAPEGMTQDNKISAHALTNTGRRKYLIVEHDTGSLDEQAAISLHLAEFRPFVLAVFSGGKSLHAWFSCAGAGDDTMLQFMRYAVSLGADDAPWTRSLFVRLPDGYNVDKGARQTTFYFDPNIIKCKRSSGCSVRRETTA